jgi:hypothetical protein
MSERIRLDPKQIAELIRKSGTETDAVLAIFKLVYPNFDDIESVEGYPACTEATWKIICREFMDLTHLLNKARAFDKQVMPGGAWMNYGFTTIERTMPNVSLPDWWVIPAPVKMKEVATV